MAQYYYPIWKTLFLLQSTIVFSIINIIFVTLLLAIHRIYQLNTNFLASYQLSSVFKANHQLTTSPCGTLLVSRFCSPESTWLS